jgi:tripeptide aminopeptidase
MGYVLDMDTPSDVIVGGPTCIFFKVKFKGKPSHSGVAPEKGISAIQTAAEAINNLRLGRIDDETTTNVGVIKGGLSMNIIPEDTEIEAECRSLSDAKARAVLEEMKDAFKKAAKKFGAQVHIEENLALEAYSIPRDSKVVQLAVNAMRKNGIKEDVKSIAGGSDATHINHKGIQTAVLGIGGRMMHSTEEYVVIDELIAITNVITTIVEDLA